MKLRPSRLTLRVSHRREKKNNAMTTPKTSEPLTLAPVALQPVVRTRWKNYAVWRQACPHNVCPGDWVLTGHKLKALSDKDAQSRLKRVFEGCGFSSMRLVAMPEGESPNEKDEP